MKKVLSILLIFAAAFGFYGGAVSINDVLDSKSYWEEESKITTNDLNTLEAGLDELKANTAAYKAGLNEYNEGLIALEDGKAQYAEGKKAIEDAEAEYGGPGVPVLANAYNSINDMVNAKGHLSAAAAIVASNSDGQVTASEAVMIYNNVNDLIVGYSLDRAVKTVAEQGGSTPEQIEAIYSGMNSAGAADDKLNAAYTVVASMSEGASAEQVKFIYEYIQNAVNSGTDFDTAVKNVAYELVAQQISLDVSVVKLMYKAIETALNIPGVTIDSLAEFVMNAAKALGITVSKDDIMKVFNGLDIAKESAKDAYEGVGSVILVYDNVSHLMKGYTPDEAFATVADVAGVDAESIKTVYENVGMFYKGVSFDQAVSIAAAATGNTPELVKQGYEGYKTYVNGKKQLADSLPQILDGEAQLAEGKKQLDQYRDGEKALRAGLAKLMGTEADPGIKSIAARVGKNETFTGVDGFFNFDAGYKGVKIGREYQDETGVLVTNELKGRAIGFGVGIGAGVIALIAAVLALLKKNKGAAIAGLIAAVAGGFGAYYSNAAGTFYSETAGSTVGNMPMIAICVLAGVALIFAIANFVAPKAEVEIKK